MYQQKNKDKVALTFAPSYYLYLTYTMIICSATYLYFRICICEYNVLSCQLVVNFLKYHFLHHHIIMVLRILLFLFKHIYVILLFPHALLNIFWICFSSNISRTQQCGFSVFGWMMVEVELKRCFLYFFCLLFLKDNVENCDIIPNDGTLFCVCYKFCQ